MGNRPSDASLEEDTVPPHQHKGQTIHGDDAHESLLNADRNAGSGFTGTELQVIRKDPDQKMDSHVINMGSSWEPSEKEIIEVPKNLVEQGTEKDETPESLRGVDCNTKQLPLNGAVLEEQVAVVADDQMVKLHDGIQRLLDNVSNSIQENHLKAVFLVDGLRNDDALSILEQAIEKLPATAKPFIYIDVENAEISINEQKLEKKTDGENKNLKTKGKKKLKCANKAKHDKLPLPEIATQKEGTKWRLEIQRKLVEKYKCVTLRIMIGLNKENIMAMCNDDYFDEKTPVLLVSDDSEASSSLHSLLGNLKGELKDMRASQKAFKQACKGFGVSDRELDKVTQKLKQYSLKVHGCKLPKKNKIMDLTTNISIAICRGMMPPITFLMDSSQEVAQCLKYEERYTGDSRIIYFPNIFQQHTTDLNLNLFKQYTDEYRSLDKIVRYNMEKLKVLAYGDESNEVKEYYKTVKDCLSEDNINKYLAFYSILRDEELYITHTPVLKFRHELIKGKHEAAKKILQRSPLDIYPYIYFNISNHWNNLTWDRLNRIVEHFKIVVKKSETDKSCLKNLTGKCICCGNQDSKVQIGRRVNKAIFELSNGMVANLFTDDGRPNLEVINPIQALMVNRLLCMQFEFVKVLWQYDKKNSLTNAILIWVLIQGVCSKGVFTKKDSSELFDDFKKYLDTAITHLLEIAQRSYQDALGNPILSKSPIFKNRTLIDIAGELKYETFFVQTIARRVVAHAWRPYPSELALEKLPKKGKLQADCKQSPFLKFLEAVRPRNKLYVHMFLYVITYISVAYYTIRGKSKDGNVMKWITLVFLISLALDEARQAIGNRGPISICLKRWWSDAWNIMDFVSMLLYFVAISLDFAGFSVARFLLAIFSFIWCLKFYQFLRAFNSIGIYIIIVQRMLPHMGNFGLVAFVAVIGYGVFMTAILFPSHDFISWSSVLMMLIRPYLLLFAETGIEQFQFSSSTTLFSTPKIPTVYEIFAVIGMCAFLLFGGILLMNLLIAVFSGVYDDVKEKSERLWVINDFELLKEFEKKPSLPIPLSIPVNIYQIGKRFLFPAKINVRSDDERVKMEKKQERLLKDFIDRKGFKENKFDKLRHKVVQDVKDLLEDFTKRLNPGSTDDAEKQE